jgi:hypothetical protein
MHIHLNALKADLTQGVLDYTAAIEGDKTLQCQFVACMRQLYPAG